MPAKTLRHIIMAAVALIAFTSGTATAQQTQTKTTETRKFTIISVDGNKVVVREPTGTRELTVPADFNLTVDGKRVGVADLRPGMSGTATITTTTTVTPVTVTEVKGGEVVRATGNSLLVRTPEGFRMFSPGDVTKRNVTIMRDGKPIDFAGLRTGDRLTATIVTEKPPQVLTEREVNATLNPAPAAAAGAPAATTKPTPGAKSAAAGTKGAAVGGEKGAAAPPPPPPAAAGGGGAPRRLPKTASSLPLIGIVGALSLAFGVSLTALRRRSGR